MQALFAACFFLFYLPFKPEDWNDMFLGNAG
jgi:hypothetical protein